MKVVNEIGGDRISIPILGRGGTMSVCHLNHVVGWLC